MTFFDENRNYIMLFLILTYEAPSILEATLSTKTSPSINLNSGGDGSMQLIKTNEISKMKKRILKVISNKFKCFVKIKKAHIKQIFCSKIIFLFGLS